MRNEFVIKVLCEQSLDLTVGLKRRKEKIKELEIELIHEKEMQNKTALNIASVLATLSTFPKDEVEKQMNALKEKGLYNTLFDEEDDEDGN